MRFILESLQFLYDQLAYKFEGFLMSRDSAFYQGNVSASEKILKAPSNEYGYFVSVSSDKNEKFITKSVKFHFHNLLCTLLKNEAWMVNHLSNASEVFESLVIPKFISLTQNKNEIRLVREYMEGSPASDESESKRIELFVATTSDLERAGDLIEKATSVPKRTALQMYFSSLLYGIQIVIKEPSLLPDVVRLLSLIMSNFSFYDFVFPNYVLSHRDLTSENIFVHKGKPVLIDLETAIWAEKGTDLALFPRFYYQEIGKSTLLKFVEDQLPKASQRRRFVRLSSYYLLQFLASEQKSSLFYTQAVGYIPLHLLTIVPLLKIERRSIYEFLNGLVLTLLAMVDTVVGFPRAEKFILCYHSIANRSWRFSTLPADFQEQMEAIKGRWPSYPLKALLQQEKSKGVSITFDDGYEDNLLIASPILTQLKIPSAIFVLGTPDSAKRAELGNKIPMLSQKQIIQLSQGGWEIGSHSNTHSRLIRLNNQDLEKEIRVSREAIETLIQNKVLYFSYPRGEFTNDIQEVVKRAGYFGALTVEGYEIDNRTKPYQIPRISIEGDLGFKQFCVLLTKPGMYYHRYAIKSLAWKDKLLSVFNL